MMQFKKNLSRLIKQELFLSSVAATEIFSLVQRDQNPGKIYRFLTNLHYFKILWTFPVTEQKRILEYIYGQLDHNSYSKKYINLINIIFSGNLNEQGSNDGVDNFLTFTKDSMENEEELVIKAGLSLIVLKIITTKSHLLDKVDGKDLVLSLLFLKDTVSYGATLHELIDLFDIHTIVPLVIDLVIEHPHKIDMFLSRTLIEYAVQLKMHQKRALRKKLQTFTFILAQNQFMGMEKLSHYQTHLLLELGRLSYLNMAITTPSLSVCKVKKGEDVTKVLNKRFSFIHIKKREVCHNEPLYRSEKYHNQ